MKVTVEQYDPGWATEFELVKQRLEVILKDVPYNSVEHVGSTSVPGLSAKPVIDIDIVVEEPAVQAARDALSAAGYLDVGILGLAGRYVFWQPGFERREVAHGRVDGRPRQNTYVMVQGYQALRNHLDVRRVLREDVVLRKEYSACKKRLAEIEYKHIDDYVAGKTEVLVKVLRKAGWSEEELVEIARANSKR